MLPKRNRTVLKTTCIREREKECLESNILIVLSFDPINSVYSPQIVSFVT